MEPRKVLLVHEALSGTRFLVLEAGGEDLGYLLGMDDTTYPDGSVPYRLAELLGKAKDHGPAIRAEELSQVSECVRFIETGVYSLPYEAA